MMQSFLLGVLPKGPFGSTEKEGSGGEVRGGIFKEGMRGKT
jgi:hypothetical protein